ncbi:heterokaryon incompatibility protein-domain-containing protein [Xylaria digitata]|nr:heterokaryon incompatibility protein-domain-containing protein [Xylaria digitata]
MRLLNTATYTLETFMGVKKPPYAILSHTWSEDEVLFEDIRDASPEQFLQKWRFKPGAAKVVDSANKAPEMEYQYIWIDTCCIDKNSSAELSEAINCMYRWYQESATCYAYLSDILSEADGSVEDGQLQELIAPDEVIFFNMKWESIGTRQSLASTISAVTKIDISLLEGGLGKPDLDEFSVHTRMTWAYERQTTRPEDRAYSLIGIFDVHMPLLYGEGGDKAFERLQGEIIKRVNDQSILLYRGYRILATSPDDFLPIPTFRRSPSVSVLERVNFELRTSLLLSPDFLDDEFLGIFESVFADDSSSLCRPAVQLTRVGSEDKFYRSDTRLFKVRLGSGDKAEVVDPSFDERIVCILDQRTLQRKIIGICDLFDLKALMFTPRGLHLRLLPIVHKTASRLFDYAACHHEKNGPLIPIHYIETDRVIENLRLMAAISLYHLEHENFSVVVLLFGVFEATQEALCETTPPVDPNPFSIDLGDYYIFPYLVNYRDWLPASRGEHLNPLNMRPVIPCLAYLPMVRKHYTGIETIYNVVLAGAPEENYKSRFSMLTSDRLRITVTLSRTPFLENEVLNFKAEIAEEILDEPEETPDELELASGESEEDRNTFSGFQRKENTSPQRSRRTTRRLGRSSYQYPGFDSESE